MNNPKFRAASEQPSNETQHTPEMEVKMFGLTEAEAITRIESTGAVCILNDLTIIETFDYPKSGRGAVNIDQVPKRYLKLISKILELTSENKNLSFTRSYLRLRKEGSEYQFTLKYPSAKQIEGVKSEDEINLIIEESEWEPIKSILSSIGMMSQFGRTLKKKRVSYVLEDLGIRYDVDTWQETDIPTYIEVEGPDKETIEKGIKLIGLNPDESQSISGKELFGKYGLIPQI